MQPQGITAYVHCSLMPTLSIFRLSFQPAWPDMSDRLNNPTHVSAWNSIGGWCMSIWELCTAGWICCVSSAGASGLMRPAQQAQVLAPQVQTRPEWMWVAKDNSGQDGAWGLIMQGWGVQLPPCSSRTTSDMSSAGSSSNRCSSVLPR
jgi:hypothetical protein